MENVSKIVRMGICVGCGACAGCEHIRFERCELGFDVPVVDAGCLRCGKCLAACSFDPDIEDE